MRCMQRRVLRWYDKNVVSSNFWNLTNDAPWILLIRGPGIRVPSSAPKKNPRSTVDKADSIVGFFLLYRPGRKPKVRQKCDNAKAAYTGAPDGLPERLIKNEGIQGRSAAWQQQFSPLQALGFLLISRDLGQFTGVAKESLSPILVHGSHNGFDFSYHPAFYCPAFVICFFFRDGIIRSFFQTKRNIGVQGGQTR